MHFYLLDHFPLSLSLSYDDDGELITFFMETTLGAEHLLKEPASLLL